MPTTSADAAKRALQGLDEGGVEYVVLDAEDKFREGGISDVDIAVGSDPRTAIRLARRGWSSHGLSTVLLWPYDIGGTLTVFLASSDGREGVQLDMLFDPNGIGKYGIRSLGLFDSVVDGEIPFISRPARLIYLWRKRLVKGQDDVLDSLRSEAAAYEPQDLMTASSRLTGSTETAEALLAMSDKPSHPKPRHPLARLRRMANRLVNPIGHWAHISHQTVAEDLATSLAGYLVVVRTGAVPARRRQLWWYLAKVRPTILRPGAYLSYGIRPSWCPPPPILIKDETADQVAPHLIAAMSNRIPA